MIVTAIERQKKRLGRYSIYIDGKYGFSLSEADLAKAGLRIGQELESKELENFRDESVLGKKYDRVLRWLALRPRSEWEIDTYLGRICPGNEPRAEQLKKRLVELGQVDDRAFAGSWVESRRLLKATNKRKLWQELKQKRVPGEVIDEVLAEDPTDELEVLKELIRRKIRQSQYQDKEKLMGYLARQGFRYDQIKAAFDELQ